MVQYCCVYIYRSTGVVCSPYVILPWVTYIALRYSLRTDLGGCKILGEQQEQSKIACACGVGFNYDHHGNQQPSQSSMYCCTGGTECSSCNTWQLGSVSQLYTSSILPHTTGAYKTYFWLKAGARAKCHCAFAFCVFRTTSTLQASPLLIPSPTRKRWLTRHQSKS